MVPATPEAAAEAGVDVGIWNRPLLRMIPLEPIVAYSVEEPLVTARLLAEERARPRSGVPAALVVPDHNSVISFRNRCPVLLALHVAAVSERYDATAALCC